MLGHTANVVNFSLYFLVGVVGGSLALIVLFGIGFLGLSLWTAISATPIDSLEVDLDRVLQEVLGPRDPVNTAGQVNWDYR